MKPISHKGQITEVSQEHVIVNIITESACSGCHAKGVCSISGMQEKEVEICNYTGRYEVGQQVLVSQKGSQGTKAVVLGYLLPLIVVMGVLFISVGISKNEGLGALIAIGSLVIYYLVLYSLRSKMKKSFEFEIEPI